MNNQKTSLRMILSITMVLLFMAPNLYANLVTNGSFEGTGAGWSKSGNVWIHGGIVHYNEFDSGISGNVWQYIPTVVGQEYRLEFDYCGHGNTAADKTKLRIYVGTTPVLIDVTESASTTPWDWRHATYTFVAQQTSTRLYFRDASTLSYQVDLHLDNVSAVQSYPPTPDAGADQIIGCVVDNTDVTLDGSESIDLDGDAMSYSWTGSFGTVAGISPTINLGLGVHPITLTVTDAVGSTATDDVTVTVNADTEAPIITLLGDNPTNLFFRDSYVEVGYTVSDDCDAGPAVEVTGTVNTESPGTYTLTYTTTDEVGNVGTAQRTVTVNSLLVNGGFEGSGSGWSRSGNVWIHGSVVHFNEHDRTANGSINQYVNTVVGQQYRLEFDYCAHGTTTSGGMRVRAHVGPSPVVLDQTLTASTVSWEWRHASYTFTAQLTSTRIWLGDSSTRTYQCDMHLNNATLIEYNPPTAVAGSDFTEVVPLSANATVTLDASASINPEDIPLSYNWSGPFGSVSGISPIVQLAPGIHTITLSIDDGIGPTVTDDIVVTIAEVNLPINGLIGYWPADGNADDVTGNFDGTLGANTVFEAGLNDQAFSFDAAQSSNVSLPVNLSPSNLPQMTMGMFVQLRSVATSSLGWVIGHDNGGYDRSLILHDYRYGSGLAAGVGHTYGSTLPKLKDNLNRWYFIAVAYDQSTNTATTYVNDLTGDGLTQTVTTSLGSGLPTASLGGLTFSNHGVHGLVDEVFMFNRTLTPAELDEICFDLAPNYIPTANAGVDQTIECVVFNGSVTLDGLGSSDPDGDPLGYSWTLDGDVLSTEATFEATVPTGSTIFTLTVNDGLAFASDEVVVTAVGDTEPPLITLDGDNPMDIGLYDEYVEAGYSAVDACETAFEFVVVSTVDVNTPDTYEITYTVEDAAGNSDVATRMVNVINTPPVTVAGEDQSFDCIVGNTSVTLDGSESTDSDGGTLIYSWALDGAVVSTEASFTTDLAAGDHTFTLTVSDGFDSSSDDILVTIVADTEPPLITLAGENPMDLGLYLEYLEPGYSAVDACESVVTIDTTRTLNINAPGSYTITYTATDEGGNFSTEVRTVNVINTAPEVVNAVDDVVLSFGDDILSAEIDLATVFADIDVNDVLVYTYNNPNADAATASLSGSILTLNAVDLGESLVEITATDPWLLSASQSFTVTVNVTTDLADAVLFAFSEIKLDKEVEVNTGNILVNDTRSADDEDEDEDEEDDEEDDDDDEDGVELKIEKDVFISAGYMVKADGIQIKKDACIASDVYSNFLDNKGDISGEIFNSVATPLFSNTPPFKTASAGNQNVSVNKHQDIILEPGDYGRITVKEYGTLTFTGGIYNIEKLETKKSSHVRFEEASEVRVESEIKIAKNGYVGPAGGSSIQACDIIFYIDGDHHAAKLEEESLFYGTIYALNGDVDIKKESSFTGAILAAKIDIDKECEIFLDSYFSSQASGLAKGAGQAWVEPEMDLEIPLVSDLSHNYPNPFNPSTTIDFALDKAGDISLRIYDIRGAQVAELAHGYYEAGFYTIHYAPEGLSSGTYLYVLNAGSFREVNRMIYLK